MNLCESMTESSRTLFRSRLHQIESYMRYRDWSAKQVHEAHKKKDVFGVTTHAHSFFLRFSEGPLRWILWALLDQDKPLMLGNLIEIAKNKKVNFYPGLEDAIYGRSYAKKMCTDLEAALPAHRELNERQLKNKEQILESIHVVESLNLVKFRNALAHQDFYISKNGSYLCWRENDQWKKMPQAYLLGYISQVMPPVEGYIEKLTGDFIEYYDLKRSKAP